MNPTFLFFGYGAEYSLRPLLDFMTAKGDPCVEIDLLTADQPKNDLKSLEGQPVVLVTSAHPLFDRKNFFFYRTDREVFSALHIMSTLKPVASVFYPHDYKDPVKDEEFAYLPLFDLLLWPFPETRKLEKLVKTKTVGWIKNVALNDAGLAVVANPGGCVFFLGKYQFYLNAGVDRLYDDYGDILNAGAAIKLPRWHGTESFEQELAERGVLVYPSEANSIDVMRANQVVLAHAFSSVALEACHLGKSVIYITDPDDSPREMQEFSKCGHLAFANPGAAAVLMHDASLPRNVETMLPFDFDTARDAIWDEWKRKISP